MLIQKQAANLSHKQAADDESKDKTNTIETVTQDNDRLGFHNFSSMYHGPGMQRVKILPPADFPVEISAS